MKKQLRWLTPILTLLLPWQITCGQDAVRRDEYEVYSAFLTSFLKNEKTLTKHSIQQVTLLNVTDAGLLAASYGEELTELDVTGHLGELLKDQSWAALVDTLKLINARGYPLHRLFQVPYQLILLSKAETNRFTKKKDGWKYFYQQYPTTYGVIAFSRVAVSADKQKSVFCFSYHRQSLLGEGLMVFMVKEGRNWKIKDQIRLWIS